MQRFGSYNIHTHEIGRECLLQNWKGVIEKILGQHAEIDLSQIARKKRLLQLVFEEQDIEEALGMLDRKDRLEKAVLLLLKRQPTGYFNAFQNIARNTRLIYVHGYQSYVWNRTVSERLRRFGSQVLVGDLVVERENADLIENEIIDEVALDEDDVEEEESKDQKRVASPVIDVTEQNISQYTIQDVVMPMVGNNVKMPKNEELTKIISDLLIKDGITMENFAKLASHD